MKTLVTKFAHAHEAERAVEKLRQDGFAREHVGWVTRADDGSEIAHGNLAEPQKGSAAERAAIGGVLGGFAGFLVGVTVLTLGGLTGPIAIAGPLMTALVGISVGAAVGRRVDAFVRVEVPREQAHRFAARLGKDAAVVTVTVNDEVEEARALEILRIEADLHRHPLIFRVPALSDEGRPSKPSLA